MTDRLNKIFARLSPCGVFADIGCDHGYIAKAMLDSGKCEKAIISDISAKCLSKAEELLRPYIESGKAESVVSDGFNKVGYCDLSLIAGMGGEEICSIINSAKILPERLVLQPMKNCAHVRLCAVNAGYKIVYDSVFKSAGKFYDLIVLEKGLDTLTQEEIEFGRDNINEKGKAFIEMLSIRIKRLKEYILNPEVKGETKENMIKEIEKLEKYL